MLADDDLLVQADTFTVTYAEVMAKLLVHPALCQRQKDDFRSAIRRFVQRFEPAGMGTVVVPQQVSAIITKATPAKAGLRESSFRNMISRLRVALKLCSVIVQPGRHTEGLDEPWATLFKPVTDHQSRSRLSRFFHTVSKYGWKPEEITGDHFHRFHRELDNHAIIKSAGRLAREAAKAWNHLAAANPRLPKVDFALPRKREPYTFAWDKYPETLGLEVKAVIKKMGTPDFLAEDHRPALRPTTLTLWEVRLRQFAAALVHRGRPHAELAGLEDLCNLTAFTEGLKFFWERAGKKENLTVIGMAQTIYTITKPRPNCTGRPGEDEEDYGSAGAEAPKGHDRKEQAPAGSVRCAAHA